jgi:hypothetical protein
MNSFKTIDMYFFKKLCLLVLLSAVCSSSFAGKNGKKKIPLPINEAPSTAALSQTLEEIEEYFREENINRDAAFDEEYFETYNTNNPTSEEAKGKARTSMKDLEASGNYIDYLSPSDVSTLPVGIKKRVGNTQVIIAVSSVRFTERYAELDLFAKVIIPQKVGSSSGTVSNNEIFFGVKGLKLSNTGGIIGNSRLVLLGDIAIPFAGGKGALMLKGGLNQQTGEFADLTYVEIDCSGFKKLGIAADVTFPRTLLLPVNPSGEINPDNNVTVKGSFTTTVNNWNDITASISLTPFQIKGLKDFNFTTSQAYFDFSDTRNGIDGVSITYPPGYAAKYLPQSAPETWRGVYVKQLEVALPKSFKKKDSTSRVTFGAENMIIDNNGISGLFYGLNILSIDKGAASGWKFGVDSIRIALEANQLIRAGFGGQIGIPVSKSTTLAYSAVITSSSDYVIRVTNKDTLDFNVFAARAEILPNSYVTLKVVNNVFKPEAMLHGSMGIYVNKKDDADNGGKEITSFKGIKFQSLLLKTDAPKFSAQNFGYEGEVKFANFPVSLSNINLTTPSADEVALNFNLSLNFEDASFGGSTTLGIVGKWDNNAGISSLKYDRININAINLYADKGAFKMRGALTFLRNDPVYGDGFAGDVKATFKLNDTITIDVKALFGKKVFRYWFFDAMATIPGLNGDGVGGVFKIHGFGGGAWYRMKKETGMTSSCPSGIAYTPDSTAGIGVRAAILFNVATKKVVEGKASFEIAFNRGGGLRYIGIYAFASFAGKLPGLGDATVFLRDKFKAIEDKATSISGDIIAEDNAIRKKMFQPTEAAKQSGLFTDTSGKGGISAYVGITYTTVNNTLNGNFDIYVNAAGGFIKGSASENRAGWARLLISPGKWHLHMGTPLDRIGLRLGIGSFSLESNGYMMIGYDVPDNLPAMPPKVGSILNRYESTFENPNHIKNQKSEIQSGRGFAFGTSLSVSTGDLNIAIFYARLEAGVGFDLLVRNKDNCHCSGQTDPIGINGWYIQGQSYAFLEAEVGIRVKLAFIKKNISIFKLGVAALMQANMPNPTWLAGNISGYYSILGGTLKGQCNIRFKVGNQCQMSCQSSEFFRGEDSAQSLNLIGSIAPANNTDKVPTTPIIAAAFELPIDSVMVDDISENAKTKIVLESVKLLDNAANKVLKSNYYFTSDKRTLRLEPKDSLNADRLKPHQFYTFEVKVSMQEWKNNSWVSVQKDGAKYVETKSVVFQTDQYPESIELHNVDYSWPVIGQANFFKGESPRGYVKLKTHVDNLFGSFQNYYAEFSGSDGAVLRRPIEYDNDKTISYDIPADMIAGASYSFKIMGRNIGFNHEQSQDYSKFIEMGDRIEPKFEQFEEMKDDISEEEVKVKVESEIMKMLRERGLSATAITFFLTLDEIQRMSFLKQAGFNSEDMYSYMQIREEVIKKMLHDLGYSDALTSQYMRVLYKTIEEKETIAVMVTNEESQKPVVEFNFRNSNYATFEAKMSVTPSQSIIGRVSTDVINLQAELGTYEGYDMYDLQNITTNQGTSGNHPGATTTARTISGGATLLDDYFLTRINGLVYDGLAPGDFYTGTGIILSSYYISCLQSGSNNSFVNRRFPFIYDLPKKYNEAFLKKRSDTINYYVGRGEPIPPQYNDLVNKPFPFMNQGQYQVRFRYRLPNGDQGTTGLFTFINNIQ